MIVTNIHQDDKNHITITCEEKKLFGLKTIERKFLAIKEFPKGYYDWVELPQRTMILDSVLEHQLNKWVAHFKVSDWYIKNSKRK